LIGGLGKLTLLGEFFRDAERGGGFALAEPPQ
jgi:hypothetical protein